MYKEIRENCSYNTTWFEVVGNHDTMMQFVCHPMTDSMVTTRV